MYIRIAKLTASLFQSRLLSLAFRRQINVHRPGSTDRRLTRGVDIKLILQLQPTPVVLTSDVADCQIMPTDGKIAGIASSSSMKEVKHEVSEFKSI